MGRFRKPPKQPALVADSLLDSPAGPMRVILGEMKADKQAMKPVPKGTFKRHSLAAANKAQQREKYSVKRNRLLQRLVLDRVDR
jgi:hypothetical protein